MLKPKFVQNSTKTFFERSCRFPERKGQKREKKRGPFELLIKLVNYFDIEKMMRTLSLNISPPITKKINFFFNLIKSQNRKNAKLQNRKNASSAQSQMFEFRHLNFVLVEDKETKCFHMFEIEILIRRCVCVCGCARVRER